MIPPRLERLEDRAAAYNLAGGAWPDALITYSLGSLADGLLGGGISPTEVRRCVAASLTAWVEHAPLRLVEVRSGGDIDFAHGQTSRGDYLAFTFFPPNGDVLIDADRVWASYDPAGYGLDLRQVLTHEVGHALGLNHADPGTPSAVAASYQPGLFLGREVSLFADDIAGIQAIYGAGRGSVTPLPDREPPADALPTGAGSDYFAGYAGPVSLITSPDGTTAATAANGHTKTFSPDGSLLASSLPIGKLAGDSAASGDFNADGVADVAFASAGRARILSGANPAAVLLDVTPFAGYAGAVGLTLQAPDSGGGFRLICAAHGHVKVFGAAGEEASFYSHEGYRGDLALSAGYHGGRQVFAAAADNGHVRAFEPTGGAAVASYIRGR